MSLIKTQSLNTVVMPLVKLLADQEAGLSWADREKISAAILACCRHHESMENERQQLNTINAQQSVAGIGTQIYGYQQQGSNIG